MDIWGAGCVLFEITALFPLFPGADEVDQINRIHKVVGTPSRDMLLKLKRNKSSKIDFKFREQSGVGIKHFIPHASLQSVDLLTKTLEYDYSKRIGAIGACGHDYFDVFHEKNEKINTTSTTKTQPTKPVPTSSRIRQSDKKKKKTFEDARNEKSSFRKQKEISELKKRVARTEKKKVGKETSNIIANKQQRKPNKSPTNNASKKVQPTRNSTISGVQRKKNNSFKKKSDDDEEKLKSSLHKQQTRLNKIRVDKKTTQASTGGLTSKYSDNIRKTRHPATNVRRKKFANVKSSGYGRTNNNPKKKNGK